MIIEFGLVSWQAVRKFRGKKNIPTFCLCNNQHFPRVLLFHLSSNNSEGCGIVTTLGKKDLLTDQCFKYSCFLSQWTTNFRYKGAHSHLFKGFGCLICNCYQRDITTCKLQIFVSVMFYTNNVSLRSHTSKKQSKLSLQTNKQWKNMKEGRGNLISQRRQGLDI